MGTSLACPDCSMALSQTTGAYIINKSELFKSGSFTNVAMLDSNDMAILRFDQSDLSLTFFTYNTGKNLYLAVNVGRMAQHRGRITTSYPTVPGLNLVAYENYLKQGSDLKGVGKE